MNDLSITRASQECPDACALITQDTHYTFAQLAALCSARHEFVERVDSPLLAAQALYRALEHRRPLCLLAKQTSDSALARVRAQLASMHAEPGLTLLLYTSGSSGTPKAVRLSHDALHASAHASNKHHGWTGNDRWLCVLPLWHIGGLSILTRCLLARKTVLLCEEFDPHEVARCITEDRATHISLVPTMLWRLLEIGFQAPAHLHTTLIGGSAIAPNLVDRAMDSGFRLQLSYGMTESTSQVICDGRPLDGVDVQVSNEGRLQLRGPMMMSGYLGKDHPKDSWFTTEDLATLDDGEVAILGRSDDTIISGGENIDPRHVEAKLNLSPQIATSYALAIAHPEWGQQLVALVVRSDKSGSLRLQDIELEGANMPKRLIAVERLPLLDTGKIDRRGAHKLALNSLLTTD